ncbi:hypothetical protein OT109_06130 [Phycisphaeraceae bacterium D3-23]
MPVVRNQAPVSNLERQRQFRARHPHYYRDLHRRKKAQIKASLAAKAEAKAAAQAEATPPVVLALPAPEAVVNDMVTLTLPDAFLYEPAKIKIVTPGSAPAPGSSPGSSPGSPPSEPQRNPTTSRDR